MPLRCCLQAVKCCTFRQKMGLLYPETHQWRSVFSLYPSLVLKKTQSFWKSCKHTWGENLPKKIVKKTKQKAAERRISIVEKQWGRENKNKCSSWMWWNWYKQARRVSNKIGNIFKMRVLQWDSWFRTNQSCYVTLPTTLRCLRNSVPISRGSWPRSAWSPNLK